MAEIIKMRTRMINSMTNYEVETYLKRNDIIYVPVGVQEMHGGMPLDIEYVGAEAAARLLAELTDGLVLPGLIYMATGNATNIGRGTVAVSMLDCIAYLRQICYSLINQGFKRIALIPAHGDSTLIINVLNSTIFDETKVTMLYLSPGAILRYKGINMGFNSLGAYYICGRINDVPTGEEVNDQPGTLSNNYINGKPDPWPFAPIDGYEELEDVIKAYRNSVMPCYLYFDNWSDHGSGPLPMTREEVNAQGEREAQEMREAYAKVDWNRYMTGLGKVNKFMKEHVIPKYADILPKNKFYPNI